MELRNKVKKLFSTGFFHIFGGSIVNKVIVFLSSVVLIRILDKSEYGIFTYAWNIYSVFLIFNGMGVDSGALQIIAEKGNNQKHANEVINYSTRIGLRFNIVICIAILVAGSLFHFPINGVSPILLSLCMLPMVAFLSNMSLTYLRAQKRNQEYSYLSLIGASATLIISSVLAFVFRSMGLVIGYYLSSIITVICGFALFHIKLLNNARYTVFDEKRALLKISATSMLINGLNQLMYYIDIFVIGLVDPQETIIAAYRVATIIPTAIAFIPSAIIMYIYPYFAEHKDDGAWCLRRYRQVLLSVAGLNAVISGILFLGAPLIVKLFFGDRYIEIIAIFKLLALNYFISGTFRTISGNLLVTQRKLSYNFLVAVISSIVNVIADYFLVMRWGSMGAAIATVLVTLITGTMATAYITLIYKKKAKQQRIQYSDGSKT